MKRHERIGPHLFGVRHLSPSGAWHLLNLLDKVNPDLVLIEGPSDLSPVMTDICSDGTVPPIAVMAYSKTVPIRSILYPLSEYSPEYQAIRWAYKNKKECRFMDLPSEVFLAISDEREKREIDIDEKNTAGDVYNHLARLSDESDNESYWERTFEHNLSEDTYLLGVSEYGRQLRMSTGHTRYEYAENLVREGYMKRQIADAVENGFAEDKIVAVAGAYHIHGLETCDPLTDAEIKALPRIPSQYTLMPYSYYRLSSISGYGAGNKAPAYYEILWNSIKKNDLTNSSYEYLTAISSYQRKYGHMSSSAEVIEAVRLAFTLANIKGADIPTLQDLRDAAVTCLGHGSFAEISLAAADTEVGTHIGKLPPGISRTSIQEDFYRLIKDLKLEKYKSVVAEDLELDLRENTRVKTQSAAFLDLERSFFLHRLGVLGIHFAEKLRVNQDRATWAENWVLRWTPEAEIEIVESALKGDTVELAAAFAFREQLEASRSISETASIIEKASLCGMPGTVGYAAGVLQGLAIEAAEVKELAETSHSLSNIIRYGNIRKLDPTPMIPILDQLFLRACLILPGSCNCNNAASGDVILAVELLNSVQIYHEFIDGDRWIGVLEDLSDRDDINTKVSGFATAILLERGKIDSQLLSAEVSRRLSRGIPADLGASWFEGLAMKNKYALISRLSLWKHLSEYIDGLDDEEFKRALVFLRRAFSDFSAGERNDIAENLGEIWGINTQQVSEILMGEITDADREILGELDDFDFGDL